MISSASLPAWAHALARERLLLALNHVLAAEPAAAARLGRHAGSRLTVVWVLPSTPWAERSAGARQEWEWRLAVSAAGLLEDPCGSTDVGLRVEVDLADPAAWLPALAAGRRPPMRIEGDAAFAADMAWVIDNLRWDAGEDLSRLIGDPAAHALVQQARSAGRRLRDWLQAVRPQRQGAERPGGAVGVGGAAGAS